VNHKGQDVSALLPELRRRVAEDFSRADLARESGVSESHISRLESGERRISVEVARKLAPALKLTPAAFYALVGFTAVEAESLTVSSADEKRLRLHQALRDLGLTDSDRQHFVDLAERLAQLAELGGAPSQ
jgi:transcriptional regulator with XRE-family HTH domain